MPADPPIILRLHFPMVSGRTGAQRPTDDGLHPRVASLVRTLARRAAERDYRDLLQQEEKAIGARKPRRRAGG